MTADRNFYSSGSWQLAAATGAALLWRAPTQLVLSVIQVLPDGTYLSILVNPRITRHRDRREGLVAAARAGQPLHPDQAQWVRVIEYHVPDRAGGGSGEVITLLSSITDPARASAADLAQAYHQRWEQETGHDQLTTHLRGPGAGCCARGCRIWCTRRSGRG